MPQESILTLYSTKCECCGGFVNVSTSTLFSDDQVDNLVEGVYTGLYDENNLPEWYYLLVASALFTGVEIGFGATLSEVTVGSLEYEYLIAMQENVYIFSAAKTYQMVSDMKELLAKYGDNEELFKLEATKIFDTYNTPKGANYLSIEYKQAKIQAKSAKNWLKILANAETEPNLKYKTQEDNRVRPEHVTLNNTIKPVNDVFWDVYYPPNGWLCRCYVIQGGTTFTNEFSNPLDHNVPEAFQFNSGKEKKVFSPKHPYFKVKRGDKELAKRNFNLPLDI